MIDKENLNATVFIVGYDTEILLITTDKKYAEEYKEMQHKKYCSLDIQVRSISEAIQTAYDVGYESGIDTGD